MILLLTKHFMHRNKKYNLPNPMKLWPHLKFSNHLNPCWVYIWLTIIRILTLDIKTKDSFELYSILKSFFQTRSWFSGKFYRAPTLLKLPNAGSSGMCGEMGTLSLGATCVTTSNGFSESLHNFNLQSFMDLWKINKKPWCSLYWVFWIDRELCSTYYL